MSAQLAERDDAIEDFRERVEQLAAGTPTSSPLAASYPRSPHIPATAGIPTINPRRRIFTLYRCSTEGGGAVHGGKAGGHWASGTAGCSAP